MRPVVVAFALFAAASPAAAEEKQKPAPPAEERPRLNLKLDNPGRYSREAPRDGGAGVLPSLGADARPLPTTPSPTSTRPFPKDSERGEY